MMTATLAVLWAPLHLGLTSMDWSDLYSYWASWAEAGSALKRSKRKEQGDSGAEVPLGEVRKKILGPHHASKTGRPVSISVLRVLAEFLSIFWANNHRSW